MFLGVPLSFESCLGIDIDILPSKANMFAPLHSQSLIKYHRNVSNSEEPAQQSKEMDIDIDIDMRRI